LLTPVFQRVVLDGSSRSLRAIPGPRPCMVGAFFSLLQAPAKTDPRRARQQRSACVLGCRARRRADGADREGLRRASPQLFHAGGKPGVGGDPASAAAREDLNFGALGRESLFRIFDHEAEIEGFSKTSAVSGPVVRIQPPPAESPQTFGSSAGRSTSISGRQALLAVLRQFLSRPEQRLPTIHFGPDLGGGDAELAPQKREIVNQVDTFL